MIDLHLHTTASDGRSTPEALVLEAAAAGLTTIAVTDHDTVTAIAAVETAARTAGLAVVPGIEITAVEHGRDVHILGYFLDPASTDLATFLAQQRADRRRRMVEMIERLADLEAPIDASQVLGNGLIRTERALGRPLLAQALVDAGHARDVHDAFARFLGDGRPAFVARRGACAADVVAIIQRAGGLASVAHPGKFGLEALVRGLAGAGLAAVEVFHPDHSGDDLDRYRQIANDCGLVMTGGSDYHGPGTPRARALGKVGLPPEDFDRLLDRAGAARLS